MSKFARTEIYKEIDSICENGRLSQEEIDNLYILDGVANKSLRHELADAKKRLNELRTNAETRLLSAVYPQNDLQIENTEEEKKKLSEKIDELTKSINDVENQMLYATTVRKPKVRNYPSKETRDNIFVANMHLARKIAQKYYYRNNGKFSYDDLFQIACEGLLSACHYYVPSGIAKFETYARRCIENKLKKELFPKKKEVFIGEKMLEIENYKIRYLKMFLDGQCYLDKLNTEIKKFNEEVLNLGYPERVLNRVGKRKKEDDAYEKFLEVVDAFIEIINDSKLDMLVSDEDRELVHQVSLYRRIKQKDLDTWTLLQYIYIYMHKLTNISWYLEITEELTRNNDGVVPTDEEVLEKLNERVKEYNSKVRKYRNYRWGILRGRTTYYDEYLDKFDVDFFEEGSREREFYEIKTKYQADIRDMKGLISDYQFCIRDLEGYSAETLVFLKFSQATFMYKTFPFVKSCYVEDECIIEDDEEIEDDSDEEIEMTVEKAIVLLKKYLDDLNMNINISDIDSAVVRELERRRSETLLSVEEKNKKVFEENRKKILDLEAMRAEGKYRKKYNEDDISMIRSDMSMFFADDEVLFSLEARNINRRQLTLSVEDEAINRAFLEDYYDCLDELASLEKEILLYWFDENGVHSMTAKEIAKLLGITPGKVYSKKDKALKKLSKMQTMQQYSDIY